MGLFERLLGRSTVNESGKALVSKSKNTFFSLNDADENYKREELFKIYKKAYETIPLVTSIIDVQCSQVVQEFYFIGPNKKKLEKWAKKVNLMQFFYNVSKMMLLYGNSYVEYTDDKSMKILNPIWMNVYRQSNGDIMGYSQIIENDKSVLWGTTGNPQEDSAFKIKIPKIDSIIHFKHNVLGSEKYGISVIRSLIDSLNIKVDMENNLKKVVFKYVAPLIWAKAGNNDFPANDAIVNTISDTLRDLQAESEITTSHLVELSVLDFNAKGMDIKTPLDHVEQQIISGGHVPPVLLGRSAGVDKATAEVQLRSFGRYIKNIQRELKIEFEDKVLQEKGLGSEEDELIWLQAEEREREVETDILRGLVTDGIITPQKANDLLPPKFQEKLPEIQPLNQQEVGDDGMQKPRPNQMVDKKVADKPTDPTQTTQNKNSKGRVVKTDRKVPVK